MSVLTSELSGYDAAERWLESLISASAGRRDVRPRRQTKDPAIALRGIKRLLRMTGSPQRGRLTVHVAGSKGKGSTAAFIETVLRTAGYSTGMLSSPHLHSYVERIRINGTPLSEAKFARYCNILKPLVEQRDIARSNDAAGIFDVLTALAFLAFRDHKVDAQVVEVGLGGLLDGTNVFSMKELVVITSLALEHTDVLGTGIKQIATEKAGIITEDTKAIVLAPQQHYAAADVIRDTADAAGVPLIDVAETYQWDLRKIDLSVGRVGQNFDVMSVDGQSRQFFIPLLGKFQIENAVTAIAAVEALIDQSAEISSTSIAAGLEAVQWPARFEVFQQYKPRIVVDGAHTEMSIQYILDAQSHYWSRIPQARLIVIFGVSRDKNLPGMAKIINKYADKIIITQSNHPRARCVSEVVAEFDDRQIEVVVEAKADKALEDALASASPDDLICVLGSLYVAAEVREAILRSRPETISGGSGGSPRA